MVVAGSVFTRLRFCFWAVFLCGFAVWASFGCDFAVDDSLVSMGACWASVVLVVDACWVTSLFTSLVCLAPVG